jgi:hypothetical protein
MITLLGSLLGFFGSAFPALLQLFKDSRDKAHELAILKMQMENQRSGAEERLEEIRTVAATVESVSLHNTYYSGIKWVDALNGTVRPVVAYAFFALYAFVKTKNGFAWTDEDGALFAAVISFYFGQRAMQRQQK